jgi:hypothetical protein
MMLNIRPLNSIILLTLWLLLTSACVQQDSVSKNKVQNSNNTSTGISDYVAPALNLPNFQFKVFFKNADRENIKDIQGNDVEFFSTTTSPYVVLDQGLYYFRAELTPNIPNIQIRVRITSASAMGLFLLNKVINNNTEDSVELNRSGTFLVSFELMRNGQTLQTISFSPMVKCAGTNSSGSFSLHLNNLKIYPLYIPTSTGPYLIDDAMTAPPWTFSDYQIDLRGILTSSGSPLSNLEKYRAFIDYNGDERFDLFNINHTLKDPIYVTLNYVLNNTRRFKVRVFNECFDHAESSVDFDDISSKIARTPTEDGALKSNPSKLVEYDNDDNINIEKSDQFFNFKVKDVSNTTNLALNADVISFSKSALENNSNLIFINQMMLLNKNRSSGTAKYKLESLIGVQTNTTNVELKVDLGTEPLIGLIKPNDSKIYGINFSYNFMSLGETLNNNPGEAYNSTKHHNQITTVVNSSEIANEEVTGIPIEKFHFGVLGEKDISQDKLFTCDSTNNNSSDNCSSPLSANIRVESLVKTTTATAQCRCDEVTTNPNANPTFTDINCTFEAQEISKKFWVHFAKSSPNLELFSQSDELDVEKIEGYFEIDHSAHKQTTQLKVKPGGCTGGSTAFNQCPILNNQACLLDDYNSWSNGYSCQVFQGTNNCGGTCQRIGPQAPTCQPTGTATYTCEWTQGQYVNSNGNPICSGQTCTVQGTTAATCVPNLGSNPTYTCETAPGHFENASGQTVCSGRSCAVQGTTAASCTAPSNLGNYFTCETVPGQYQNSGGDIVCNGQTCGPFQGTRNFSCQISAAGQAQQANTYTCHQITVGQDFISNGGAITRPTGCANACPNVTVWGTKQPVCSTTTETPTCQNGSLKRIKRDSCGQQCGWENLGSCAQQ